MRILIADDQERVRFALRVLLAQQPGLQVVGEAANGEALLAQAGAVAADLALVDWELPRLAEAGGLPGIHRSAPALQIVVLSSRPGVRQAALAMGGAAFVSKGEPPERLLTVIRRCGAVTEPGGPMLPPNDYLAMQEYELNRLPDVLARAEQNRLLREAGLMRRPWLTCQVCRSLWRLGRLLETTGQRLERRYAPMVPSPA